MAQIVLDTADYFTVNEEQSFIRIVTTALGTRVVRPHFGSKVFELVDKTMNEEWKMLFQRYLLECFYDEKRRPWDIRLKAVKTKIISINATKGEVVASIEFENKNKNLEFSIGGFR